jgi:hypothetical protein
LHNWKSATLLPWAVLAAASAALALASSLGAGNLAIADTLNKEASTKAAKLINDFFMV